MANPRRSPSEIVFIHGYGTDITSIFQSPLDKLKKFKFLQLEFSAGQAVGFYWALSTKLTPLQTLSPLSYTRLYTTERTMANDIKVLHQLNNFLISHKSKIIFAHSLGCYLVCQYLNQFELPASVQKIYFTHADISQDFSEFSQKEKIVESLSKIEFANYYLPWDQTLIFSSLYHQQIRAGLLGLNNTHLKNIHLKVFSWGNPHNLALRVNSVTFFNMR